jgi:hypothetical protein
MRISKFIFAIGFLFLLVHCKKKNEQVAQEPGQISAAVNTPTVDPWNGLVFAENTPDAIKTEIKNWQRSFCVFAEVTEHRYLDGRLFLFDPRCEGEYEKYLLDSMGTIQCVVGSTTIQDCFGDDFSFSENPRITWNNYSVVKGNPTRIRAVNHSLMTGDKTFLSVEFSGSETHPSEIDHFELVEAGYMNILKVYYRMTNVPLPLLQAPEPFYGNVEFTAVKKGTFIIKSEFSDVVADTIIVR